MVGLVGGTLLEVYQGIQIWKVIIHIHPHISDLFFFLNISLNKGIFQKKSCPTKKHKHMRFEEVEEDFDEIKAVLDPEDSTP